MTTLVAQPLDSDGPQRVAPYWHTALLVAIVAGVAISGAVFQNRGGTDAGSATGSLIPLYLSLLAMEWGLFLGVRRGLRASGTTLSDLIGPLWNQKRGLLVDVFLGLALWAVWELLAFAWTRSFGAGQAASISGLLPSHPIEIALWLAVSGSAGFCEEFAFRGYFQRQFGALTHSRWLGLLLQALLFGIAHGYEGAQACLRIGLYGLLFGLLAYWRKGLRAGMFGHALTDIVAGIFGF